MGSYGNEYSMFNVLWCLVINYSYKYNVATTTITYCDICLFHESFLNE